MERGRLEDGVYYSPALKSGFFIDPNAAHIIKDPETIPLVYDMSTTPFLQLTFSHGRSVIDKKNVVFNEDQALHDEYGNFYGKFNIKGNLYHDQRINYSYIEPNELRTNGALDHSLARRCVQASKVLRKAGVLCEWPIYAARPRNFPVDSDADLADIINITDRLEDLKITNLLGFKYALSEVLDFAIQNTQQLGLDGDLYDYSRTQQKLRLGTTALEGLSKVEYGVMYRACLSNCRIGDIGLMQIEDRYDHLREAVIALQQRKLTGFHTSDVLMELNPDNTQDLDRYLRFILPAIVGENLARLHNSDMYHKYPHISNWTIAGEIVDLDSVRGSGAYSSEAVPTATNRYNDWKQVLGFMTEMYKDWDEGRGPQNFFAGYVSGRNIYWSENPTLVSAENKSFLIEQALLSQTNYHLISKNDLSKRITSLSECINILPNCYGYRALVNELSDLLVGSYRPHSPSTQDLIDDTYNKLYGHVECKIADYFINSGEELDMAAIKEVASFELKATMCIMMNGLDKYYVAKEKATK